MRNLVALVLLFACLPDLSGQEIIPLYEGLAPGSETWDWQEGRAYDEALGVEVLYNISQPTLEVYLPSKFKATGSAVVIAPGGGFRVLAMEHEGRMVARKLADKGIAAFVLKYRVGHTTTQSPFEPEPKGGKEGDATGNIVEFALADGLRAMEYVRNNAKKFNLHANQIGMMGFSAGGTLALSVAYNASEQSQPNFIIPVYPYEPSIIGSTVPASPTPIFLTVAGDDEYEMAPMALSIYNKWYAAGQPAELHVYERGKHGFGMINQELPVDNWSDRLLDWMRTHGFRKKLNPSKYEKLYGEVAVEKGVQLNMIKLSNDFGGLQRYKAANSKIVGQPDNGDKVVLLGNSITDAWASLDSLFFVENKLIGRGISGQTSTQLLVRFRQDVLDLKPKAVVIHIGTNDVAENTGPYDKAFTLGNITSMITLAKANGIDVVLASALPATQFQWRRELGDRSAMIVELNNGIRKLAAHYDLRYVDYHSALKNAQNGMDFDLAKDGVHPTMKAYSIMGQLLLEALE